MRLRRREGRVASRSAPPRWGSPPPGTLLALPAADYGGSRYARPAIQPMFRPASLATPTEAERTSSSVFLFIPATKEAHTFRSKGSSKRSDSSPIQA